VHPPVRSLAEQLRRHAPMAYCNAYAAWGSSPGLGIHYDYTNIIVLQVEGRKHWKVYRPTRKAVRGPESTAYKEALQQAERGESGDVAELHRVYEGLYWEGMLERGDALFLPPGWFHAALPAGDPTLHLSCAFDAPMGTGDDAPSIRLPHALRERQSLPEQRLDIVS
jgi:ribosomal protein L16 Arg81 hydroxylase